MPKDLESFIKKHGIFKKLDQLPLKETFAINLILKFMDDRHFDQEMMSLVVVNHNSYRLIFSTVCKIIYFHRSKCHIQNIFVDDLRRRKIAKGEQRKKHLLSSNPHEQIQMIKIDPYEVKIDHVPLTEAVNVHKEEKPGLQRALKKRLHEMNKSEKKSKEIPRQFFVEKHKNIVNFFKKKKKIIFNIIFPSTLLFVCCLFSMEEVRNYKRYRLPYLQETEDYPSVEKVKSKNYDKYERVEFLKFM